MSMFGSSPKKRKIDVPATPIGPINNEPVALTELMLQHLTLEEMICFIELSDEQIEAAELHKGHRSRFESTLRAKLLSVYQTLKDSGVRLIQEDTDEPHIIVARTIQEQIREVRSLFTNSRVNLVHKRQLLDLMKRMTTDENRRIINNALGQAEYDEEDFLEAARKQEERNFEDATPKANEVTDIENSCLALSNIKFTPRSAKELQETDTLLNEINNRLALHKILQNLPIQSEYRFRNKGLTRLTKEMIEVLQKNRKLNQLDLSNNSLTSIDGVKSLPSVLVLDLSCNTLSSLKGIHSFSALTVLTVLNSKLPSLRGINSLKNLCSLSVGFNNLSSLKEIEDLPDLASLELGGNPLDKLTESSRAILERTGNHKYLSRIKSSAPSPVFLPLLRAQLLSSSSPSLSSSSLSSSHSCDKPPEKTRAKRQRG